MSPSIRPESPPEGYAGYPHDPGTDYPPTEPGLVGPADEDLDLLAERPRPGKLTYVLIGLIAAGLVFMGGVWTQKHVGSSSTTTRAGGFAAAAGARAGGAEGFGAGGFGAGGRTGGEGFPAGGFAGAGGTGAGSGTGTAGGPAGAASAVPVVVGNVTTISGTTMVVKNLGGKSVTVKVPAGTTISIKTGRSLSGDGLKKGATVSVAGSTSSTGEVTATSITITS